MFEIIDLILIYAWLGFLTFYVIRSGEQNLKLHESNLRCIDAMQKIVMKDVSPEDLKRFKREMDAIKRRGNFKIHEGDES